MKEGLEYCHNFFETKVFMRFYKMLENVANTPLIVWLDYETNDNLSTNCVQFLLVLSSFCPEFVTTKTTKIFVFCQVFCFFCDKFQTKTRQIEDKLSFVS